MLMCSSCDNVHDLDEAPDTGVCIKCGGYLIENIEENRNSITKAFTELIAEAYLKLKMIRKTMGIDNN